MRKAVVRDIPNRTEAEEGGHKDSFVMGNLKGKTISVHVNAEPDISSVVAELERAERKFPGWPVDPIHGAMIVMEEAGEAAKAAMHYYYEKGALDDLRKELIQTAAMALRFLAFLDKESPHDA